MHMRDKKGAVEGAECDFHPKVDYNRISQSVGYTILSERSLKLRIEKLEQPIEVANVLCDFKNCFDVMGIISAFDSYSLFRSRGTLRGSRHRRGKQSQRFTNFVRTRAYQRETRDNHIGISLSGQIGGQKPCLQPKTISQSAASSI
jgi:hypothetical protein